VLGVLAYANSFSNPFILDDRRAVVENEQIRRLWPLSNPLSPPAETPVARRPIVNVTFALNYAMGGLDVRGYHVGNLALHLLSSLVLFGLVRRTLTLASLSVRFGAHATPLALICALAWLLHPLQTEVINYVSQRTTAALGLFYLLTLYCSIRAYERRGYWPTAAVLACAAGMASKESMVTAPVMVLLLDRVLLFRSFADAIRRRRSLYLGLFSTWVLLAILMAGGGRTTVGFNTGVDIWTYLLNQPPILLHYLRLVVWPRALVVDYGMTPPVDVLDVLWPSMAILALLIGALMAMRRWPVAGFLCLAFFILLAPTSSIVPIASEVGAERRMYLPLAAIVILAVCLVYRGGCILLSRRTVDEAAPGWRGSRAASWIPLTAVAILCAALTAGTYLRNREYHSELTLANTTVERRPHGRGYFALGYALFEAGRRDEALDYFRRSSEDFPRARFALGTELIADGHLDAGIEQLRMYAEALPFEAAVGSARYLIATTLLEQRQYAEALGELDLLLRIEPRNARAHAMLGEVLLLSHSRPDDAARHLQVAAALSPADARIHNLLGNALAVQRRYQEARVQFRAAVELDPGHQAARASLARLDRMLGAPDVSPQNY
jgi:protein O-mannosyl-transferase